MLLALTVRVTHDHRSAPGREENRKTSHEPGRHATEGVPRDFVGVLVRAPILEAALALPVVAQYAATSLCR